MNEQNFSENSDTLPASGDYPAAISRGFRRRCPRCGGGRIFMRYLKVNRHCSSCGLELASYRSDDAPPYFTIFIVAHVVMPSMLLAEQMMHPPEWLHAAVWLPLAMTLTLTLLPRIKGAVIGWQWATAVK